MTKNISLIFLLLIIGAQSKSQDKSLRLWYQQAAALWVDALPVGNGRMGAMVFVKVKYKGIQINGKLISLRTKAGGLYTLI